MVLPPGPPGRYILAMRPHTRRSPSTRALRTLALAAGLALGSCATTTTIPETQLPPPLSGLAGALAESGGQAFTVTAGRLEGAYGKPLAYETYRPARTETQVMVFLAHGFMRDLTTMRGWAAHWASHGVPVTVMSLRNSTWFNGRHDRNAADLRLLARTLHDGPVLYAGYSAGGLAALLAAAGTDAAGTDTAAAAAGTERGVGVVAYLGLDAVDSGGLALSRRDELSVPALFLLAEAGRCNARGNILKAVPRHPGVTVLRVQSATHCHFENPTDRTCERLCGTVEPPEASRRITARIHSLATAWVLAYTGILPEAAALAGPGPGVEALKGGAGPAP